MQARNRQKIRPETVVALMESVFGPRRPGGPARAIGIVSRSPCGEVYRAFFSRDLKTPSDLHDFFSSMLEEEAVRLLGQLDACASDPSDHMAPVTVLRMEAA
jgi:hypothetical protein